MDELRRALPGAWRLESFVSRDERTGVEHNPFGEHPAGLILYTNDGYMSAQLTPGPGAEYVAYAGAFTVDEETATVHHAVRVSSRPDLLARPQFRHAQIDGDRLTLSATQTSAGGQTTHSTLVWRRASATPDGTR
jgi:Lipocalin-like domain